MKKQLLVCALVFVATSLLAQPAKKFPFGQRFLQNNREQTSQKAGFLKSGNTIKPLQGRYYDSFDEIGGDYRDSTSFVRTYFPDGNIKTEEHTSLETGQLVYKNEYSYDAKGYLDTKKNFQWIDTSYQCTGEVGNTKLYDSLNRITRYHYFYVDNTGDTASMSDCKLVYSNDSVLLTSYSPNSTAPNQLDEKWIFSKKNGAAKYTNIEISYWESSNMAYGTETYSNLEWNGACELERLFWVKPYDIWYSYFELASTFNGVTEEYRATAFFSPNKDEVLFEAKPALVYIKDSKETYTRDNFGNYVLFEYESDYNPVTQKYDSFYRAKTDNSYNQENLTKEIHSYSNTDNPEYKPSYEIWYSDFADVAGINKVKSNIVLDLYPNPANAKLVVSASEKIISLQVQSLNGAFLPTVAVINNKTAEIETTDLPNGVYLISTTSAKGVGKAKFMVSH